MGFCTKCGQEIVEGQPHICPADNNQQYNQQYSQPNNQNVNITVNTDKVDGFFGRIKNSIVGTGSAQNDGNIYERNKKIVPDCVVANDGEYPIRQYDIAKMKTVFPYADAEGRLQITNKRVLFRGTGLSVIGRVSMHEEFNINEISGIDFKNRPEFNIMRFLADIIFTAVFFGIGFGVGAIADNISESVLQIVLSGIDILLGLAVFAGSVFLTFFGEKFNIINKLYDLRQVFFATFAGTFACFAISSMETFYVVCAAIFGGIGVINLIMMSIIPNLTIEVKTKGGAPAVLVKRETPLGLLSFLFGQGNEENSGFAEIRPWTDTDIAIREIGTIIDDIHTIGDNAVAKWQR